MIISESHPSGEPIAAAAPQARRRLLFIAPDFPPPMVAGSMVYFLTLIDNSDLGFDVLAAPTPPGLGEIASPRHRVLRTPSLAYSLSATHGRLVRQYAFLSLRLLWAGLTRRYDLVVLGVSAIGNGFFCVLGRLLGLKIVVVAIAEEIPLAQRAKGLKGYLKWLLLPGYRLAQGIVCSCEFVREALVGIGIDERRTCLIPTPLNPRRGISASAGTRREADGSFRVLTVARLVERKGVHLLLRALALLRRDVPAARLTIVGDGDEKPRLETLASELGLEDAVTFTGTVRGEAELQALYAGCDVFVLANIFLPDGNCEGCPNSVIEASAQGKPVIVGDRGGTTTAVRHGVTGWTVDPRDVEGLAGRLRELYLDPALAERFGRAGIERVREQHDPALAGRKFSDFIRSILDRGEDGRAPVRIPMTAALP